MKTQTTIKPSILKGDKDAVLDEEMASHYALILANGVDDQDVEKYKSIFSNLEKMLEMRLQAVGLTLSAGLHCLKQKHRLTPQFQTLK